MNAWILDHAKTIIFCRTLPSINRTEGHTYANVLGLLSFEIWRGIVADRCTERSEEPNGLILRVEEHGHCRTSVQYSLKLCTKV